MIDEKIARAKALIQQREAIDAELSALFGLADAPKRGRPRRESAGSGAIAQGNGAGDQSPVADKSAA